MKGITPVIAIILLLLMAVAAAGAFYFMYQNFSSTGQKSGSSQIGQLGSVTSEAITIETISGGNVWVKNVGTRTLDTEKSNIYVDGVPVDTDASSDSLTEGGVVNYPIPSGVDCSGGCKVRVVIEQASSTRTAQEGDLVSECGDGTCSANEKYQADCWQDCGLVAILTATFDGVHLRDFPFSILTENGYGDEIYNVTESENEVTSGNLEYDTQGGAMLVFVVGVTDDKNVAWAYYDGSSVGAYQNFTVTDGDEHKSHLCAYGDNYLALWHSEDENMVQFVEGTLGNWGDVQNITSERGDTSAKACAMSAYGKAMFWGNASSGVGEPDSVVYTINTGSGWSTPANVTEYETGTEHNMMDAEYDKNGNLVLVWDVYDGSDWDVNYSIWDGSSWSEPAELTDDETEMQRDVTMKSDARGNLIAVYVNSTGYRLSRTWDGTSWSSESTISTTPIPNGQLLGNRNGAIGFIGFDGSFHGQFVQKTLDGWETTDLGPMTLV